MEKTDAGDISAGIRTAQREQNRGKKQNDQKTYGAELQPGNSMLVRNFRERGGPGKLRSYWEDKVHVVTERKHKDSPVYVVWPESVLHRNLLLPCNFLPIEEDKQEKKEMRRKTKSNTDERKERWVKQKRRDPHISSEDEGDWRFITT